MSLFVCPPHSKLCSISSNIPESLPCLSSGQKPRKQGETGQKLKYICLLLCFLGIFGDQRGQNLNIFLKIRKEYGRRGGRLACLHCVHWLQVVQGFGASGGLSVCVPLLLSSLSLCLWCVACKYGSISHFKGFLGGFICLVWVCAVLVLCVACGAFVC